MDRMWKYMGRSDKIGLYPVDNFLCVCHRYTCGLTCWGDVSEMWAHAYLNLLANGTPGTWLHYNLTCLHLAQQSLALLQG